MGRQAHRLASGADAETFAGRMSAPVSRCAGRTTVSMRRALTGHFDADRPAARNPGRSRAGQAGFSLVELLIVIGIIVVLASIVMTALAKTRRQAQSVQCLSNLRVIHDAFLQYAADNDEHYPTPQAAGVSWESMLQRYIVPPLIFACPADPEIFPTVGSSYDWRDQGVPASSLYGKRLSDVKAGDLVLAFETLPGWHGRHLMNVVMTDGQAFPMNDDEGLANLLRPIGLQQIILAPGVQH